MEGDIKEEFSLHWKKIEREGGSLDCMSLKNLKKKKMYNNTFLGLVIFILELHNIK